MSGYRLTVRTLASGSFEFGCLLVTKGSPRHVHHPWVRLTFWRWVVEWSWWSDA